MVQKADRNTKFYHQHASERRKIKEQKKELVKEDDGVAMEVAQMCEVVAKFYKKKYIYSYLNPM